MTGDRITSTANPLVKDLADLATRRGRERTGSFLVEGRREVDRAIEGGCEIDLLVLCPELLGDDTVAPPSGVRAQLLGEAAFRKLSRRQRPDGVAARAVTPSMDLGALVVPADPLVLVAEGIEKPGNLGAMVRTAAALGVDAIVVCDPVTDVFNPNVIRSSQGAVFGVALATAPASEGVAWLADAGITAIAGVPEGGVAPWDIPVGGGLAVVVGSEADGLSPIWLESALPVTIPMAGSPAADSLNAATAAAVLLYEAVRRRTVAG